MLWVCSEELDADMFLYSAEITDLNADKLINGKFENNKSNDAK